jgi:hypothetical protein
MRELTRRLGGRLRLRSWIIVSTVLVLLLIAPWAYRSRFVTARRADFSFRQANADQAARKLEAARHGLRAGLALRPDAVGPRAQLAVLELNLGDPELAFLEYQTLTEMAPSLRKAGSASRISWSSRACSRCPRAILDNAVDADPRRVDAHRIRGDLRFRLGRYHALRDAEAASHRARRPRVRELLVRARPVSRGGCRGGGGPPGSRRDRTGAVVVQPLAWLLANKVTVLKRAPSSGGDPHPSRVFGAAHPGADPAPRRRSRRRTKHCRHLIPSIPPTRRPRPSGDHRRGEWPRRYGTRTGGRCTADLAEVTPAR